MQDKIDETKLKLTIGIPVYNGEKFLRQRLDSLLLQSFMDVQIIISDNASSDSTQEICKEYEMKDKRIRYVRQEKNIGSKNNFLFVLEQAKTEYFVWAAVDDIMTDDFLHKAIKVLESDSKSVGCIGKIDYYTTTKDESKHDFVQLSTITGSFDHRVRFYLKNSSANMIYSVFRAAELKSSVVKENIGAWDSAIVINILRFGNIIVLDEIMLRFFSGGISSSGIINRLKTDPDFQKISFPSSLFVYWCIKNLGIKFCLRNSDLLIKLGIGTFRNIITELFKK